MKEMIYETFSPEETRELGRKIGSEAMPGSVYTLVGDLGVGKTVFTQGIAEGLGIDEPICSPTFTIVQVYEDGRMPFYHFDVYRIGDVEVLTKEEEDELFDLPVKIQGIELECGLYDYKADIYVMQNTTEAAINDMQRDLDTMELPEEIVADLQNRIKHLTPVYEKYKAVMEEADRHPDADYKEISRSLYAEMQVVWEIINK